LATTPINSGIIRMDEFYIKKVLEGDHNAFRYFIKTYKKFAFSASFAILKDSNLAEDAVQESFIKAYRHLKSFKGNSKFQTWLGRIVINESLKRSKQKVVEKIALIDISEQEIVSINESADKLLQDDQKRIINEVFKNLLPNESLALELFYLKENSLEEVTEITGWSISKTKMLLLRGRKSFYNNLKQLLKSDIKEIL
jgi:RNA polymerase sigma-70 factor, ECF subfamily